MLNPMPSPIPPQDPRSHLPSRRTGAILAALMLAAGIALGALLGPGPASSLASGTRAEAIARALAPLLALDGASAAGSGLLGAAQPSSPPAGTSVSASSHHAPPGAGSETSATSAAGQHGAAASRPTESSSPSPGAASPTPKTAQSPGAGGEAETKGAPLPPIAQAWLIVLPYGQSFANAQAQPTAAPYIDGQLVGQGTLLSSYSALAGSQLADAATLLSGQVAAGVNVISPPPCASATNAAGNAGAAAGGQNSAAAAGTQGAAGGQSTAEAGGAESSTPCPPGEPAGLQAADAFVRETVSRIVATAGYREHGLIAIAFAGATPATGSSTATPGAPTAGTPNEVTYPAPSGVLLLSPFLRAPGRRLQSAFDASAPHRSLEEVLVRKGGSG